jgi:imidazolonepropionase
MPTLLPSCSFFLNIPFGKAREMMQNDLPIALATDYNPGTTPSGNMLFLWSLACIKLRMTPVEALNAMTINSAYAMGLSDSHGTISVGKKANVIITKEIPSLEFLPYSFGANHLERVIVNGK